MQTKIQEEINYTYPQNYKKLQNNHREKQNSSSHHLSIAAGFWTHVALIDANVLRSTSTYDLKSVLSCLKVVGIQFEPF